MTPNAGEHTAPKITSTPNVRHSKQGGVDGDCGLIWNYQHPTGLQTSKDLLVHRDMETIGTEFKKVRL